MKLATKTVVRNVLFLLVLIMSLASCAERVEDIDRTQANKVRKADLEGTWYFLETVTDVPATSEATFEGEMSKMEKIVWRVEESYLIAYRSYPIFPGSENVDDPTIYNDPEYHEEPVAAYPIQGHFDLQRTYNSSTGEQSNVLEENSWDRPWYEREYMRVDWSDNRITDFDFVSGYIGAPIAGTFAQDRERELERSMHFERNDADELVYFDVPRKMFLEPDEWGCYLSSPWYAEATEDCTAATVEMVSAFVKTEDETDYEPLPYDDRQMSRFGFFLSERYTFDPQRGVTESGRIKLLQRHNFWEDSFRRAADGSFERTADGARIPIPISERVVRPVRYYLNEEFPTAPEVHAAGLDTIAQWNAVGREVVAQAQGKDVSQVPDVFVACHSPVQEVDNDVCGPVGFSPRPGDPRYSRLTWVNSETQAGLLGYGPSAADPETGEIVSGHANVYGAAINTYASYALDVIRFSNGDLTPPELVNADHVREMVRNRTAEFSNTQPSERLRDIPNDADRIVDREKRERRNHDRTELRRFDRSAVNSLWEKARDAGLSSLVASEELEKAAASTLGMSVDQLTPEELAKFDPTSFLNPTRVQERFKRRRGAMARGVDFDDMLDPNVLGIARDYEGRTDYDQIWEELRSEIFKSTALHEMGHTLGLRHNFQGSYDSLNYFDDYWNLRRENLEAPGSFADLYTLNQLTEGQIDGRMREFQYSSIMDYGMGFSSDIRGLGKYDRSAIMYGYSAGTEVASGDDCADGVTDAANGGRCLIHRPGFIEVFTDSLDALGEAGDILSATDTQGVTFEDPTTPIIPYLERWHYTTFIQSFPRLASAFSRQWMRADEYEAERSAGGGGRHVRVPYLFCSDEWSGAMLSCNLWDAGADPFEAVQNVIADYRAYYYFDYFKRDRYGWQPWSVLFSHFFRTFLPLSDYYQNWYLSEEGYDDTMDNYYWIAVNSGLNLIAESLATPQYGTYCTGKNGELFNLTQEAGGTPEETSEFYLQAYCDTTKPFYEVAQGDGRRHFTAYDIDSGYNFALLPLEAGHYWSTMAAVWALVDPEAYVLGTDGDTGTFAISFYDVFDDEVNRMVNNIITESYGQFAPVLEVTGTAAENRTGTLHHKPLAQVYDADQNNFIDPETGVLIEDALGPATRSAICEPCTRDADCYNATGLIGGTFCQPIGDGAEFFCFQDCSDDPGLCDSNETCDDRGNCVPVDGSCDNADIPVCSAAERAGQCPTGQACTDGRCVDAWPVVQSDVTFSMVDDLAFYGMLYTTSSFSTRYNDNLNIYRLGGAEELQPGAGFELVSFTDPIQGQAYGAVREECGIVIGGGDRGLCERCGDDTDCAGYTGRAGGTFCFELGALGDVCAVDCSAGDACPNGTSCSAAGICEPDSGACTDLVDDCGPRAPLGGCQSGETCVEGTCLPITNQSSRCQFGLSQVAGAAQMVVRGQELAERYNAAVEGYWSTDGSDPELDDQLFREYSRARFEMESHIEKINDIRAVFSIFGKVY